jgi:hypothetical protein
MVLTVNSDYFVKKINQLIFVMVKCGVLFEVRTGFLNNIWTSFGLKGLRNLKGGGQGCRATGWMDTMNLTDKCSAIIFLSPCSFLGSLGVP